MKKHLHLGDFRKLLYEGNNLKFQKKIKNICISIIGILSLICFSYSAALSKIATTEKKISRPTKSFKNQNSNIDTTLILQKCLDTDLLIPYLSKNTNGNYSKLFVMQYPIAFSSNLSLSKFGELVTFLSRQELSSINVKAFFIFKVFSIDGNSAKVEFNYYNNTAVPQVVEITANLLKSGAEWKINNSTFNHK